MRDEVDVLGVPTGAPDLQSHLRQLVVESELVARTAGPPQPPTLAIRLPSPARGPADPLHGHEIWHATTPTAVLLGPRATRMAELLLDHLDHDGLRPLRLRMDAAEPNAGPESTLGTLAAVCTLACWPARRRAELVAGVTAAAQTALQHLPTTRTGSTASALRWLIRLATAFPEDPLALTPVLLQLRSYDAGSAYPVPPGQLHAHLDGTAVGLASVHTELVCGGLAGGAVDGTTFATAIGSRHGVDAGEPGPHTVRYTARLAGDLGASLNGR